MTHTPQPVQGGKLDPSAQTGQSGKAGVDRVEFSDRARALLVASESLDKAPKIRMDKVEPLKQRIKNGAYHVPGEKIAERLLGEGLFA
jgi:flagellar biosynthesis anti-sigma factor FlgM